MITERTLKKWRAEALADTISDPIPGITSYVSKLSERILRLTQVLLDQHLLMKAKIRKGKEGVVQ